MRRPISLKQAAGYFEAAASFSHIFPDILRAATRSHTYGGMRIDAKCRQFLTRYSAFVYGTPLEPIADPESLLTVDAKLMPILPLIARPESTDALIVAFGMGTAFRTSLIAGLRADIKAQVAEKVRAQAEGARTALEDQIRGQVEQEIENLSAISNFL